MPKPRHLIILAIIVCAWSMPTANSVAITAEVAKTCNRLTALAFPPREPGNPAAGSAKGSGADRAEFFKRCVANGGKADGAEGAGDTGGSREAPKQ